MENKWAVLWEQQSWDRRGSCPSSWPEGLELCREFLCNPKFPAEAGNELPGLNIKLWLSSSVMKCFEGLTAQVTAGTRTALGGHSCRNSTSGSFI